MRSKMFPLLSLVMVLGLLAGCAQPTPETVVVQETVIVEGTPQTIEVEKIVTPTPEPEPTKPVRSEDTLVFNLDRGPLQSMDATQTLESTSKKASFQLSEPLVKFNWEKGDIEPLLATSWDVSDDGKSITLKLQEGVTFVDGTPFNADAVVFNIRRGYDPDFEYYDDRVIYTQWFTQFDSVEALDEYTVKINLAALDPTALWTLSTETFYQQSPTAVMELGEEYGVGTNVVGTGPYVLKEFDPDTIVVMEKYDNYWGPGYEIENVIFKVGSGDDQAKVADLYAGNVDVITRPPIDMMDDFEADPEFEVLKFDTTWTSHIVLNTIKGPTADVKVRQAMNYGFDRDTLNEVLNAGQGAAMYTSFPTFGRYYNPDQPQYRYDPDKAKAMLDDAGWIVPEGGWIREKDGVPFTIQLVQAGILYGTEAPIPELFQANMKDLGINVQVVRMEAATMFDPKVGVWNPDNFDACVMGWIMARPDPVFFFIDRATCAKRSPNGFNMSQFCDARFDELAEILQNEVDDAKREAAAMEMQMILGEASPRIEHSTFRLVMVARAGLKGIIGNGNWTLDLSQAHWE